MDWEFTKLGIYPMQQRGVFGVFAHPLVHSSFKHLFANTLPFSFFHGACSILPANCALHSISHLDLLWHIDFLHWETRLAHRLQRYNLRTGLFSFLQWTATKIRTTHCHFATGDIPLWRTGMEYVSTICQSIYFLGRTS